MMYIIHGNTLHCFWKVQIIKNEFLKNVQFCISPGLCGSDQQYDFSYSLCYLTWNQQYHKNIICLLILKKFYLTPQFWLMLNIKKSDTIRLSINTWKPAMECSGNIVYILFWEEILRHRWMGCLSLSPQNSVLNICMSRHSGHWPLGYGLVFQGPWWRKLRVC